MSVLIRGGGGGGVHYIRFFSNKYSWGPKTQTKWGGGGG